MSVSAILGLARGRAPRPRKGLVALAIPIMLALTGCGESDSSGSSDTTTGAESDSPVLIWDGTDCIYDGPAEVTAGAVAVDFVNNGDTNMNTLVLKLDSATIQDVMDEYVTEPNASRTKPEGTTDMGKAYVPAAPGETQQWARDLATDTPVAPGEYVLLCIDIKGLSWFGSGLTVVKG